MELYNKKENPNLTPENSRESDLHDEGIDLVGSGVSEENEFTEESSEIEPAEVKQPEPPLKAPEPEPVTPAQEEKPEPPRKEERQETAVETPIKNDPSIKPLRTFKTDAEEAVRYKNISAVDIAVAEQKRREANPIEYVEEKQSHRGLVAGALILILIFIAGGYYWFRSKQTPDAASAVPTASVETIIPYSKGSTLVIYPDSDPILLTGAKLAATDPGLGNVYALIPTLNATSTAPAPVAEIFKGTHAPSRLLRSLSPEYMVGSYVFEATSPFIILKDTFFQNAFAGMLDWEKNMRNDLLPLIQVTYPKEISISTDSDKFEDAVISNIDARILKNSEGKTILAYAFADPETIVISTSETALRYVLDRLLTVRSVQ